MGRNAKKGFTLVELLVAVSLISIGILVMVQSFSFIQRGIQASKNKTIAANLCQEKMQILKQASYYNIVPTTAPAYLTSFTPNVGYDKSFFPPEPVTEAGVNYTRYTFVQVIREDSGNMAIISPTNPDTGMRMITVTTVWQEKGENKKVQFTSIIANPDTVMANCILKGKVQDSSTFAAIPNALVNLAENMGFMDRTDGSGNYNMSVNAGSYNMLVSARGYFQSMLPVSIAQNETKNNDFNLVKMATGTVYGYPWIRDHLVISEVVGSTVDSTGYDQEFVEIFNPTTWTWTVDGNIGLKYQRIYDDSKRTILTDYLTDEIPSGGFYLFANTGTVNAGGVIRTADAVWSASNNISDFPDFANQKNIIRVSDEGGDEGGGAIELYRISDGRILDQVGWNRNNGASGKKAAPFYETSPIPQDIGLQRNELYMRFSSTDGVSASYGSSYDSNNNSIDFYDYSSSIPIGPRNSSNTLPVISATPAEGAIITCSDGLSSPTTVYLSASSPPYPYFTLVDVATGTWTVMMASNSYTLENDTITIPSAGSVYTFPSTSTFLDSQISWGYVTGKVVNVLNQPINPGIPVTNYAYTATTNISTGRYILMVSTGYNTITANPNNENHNYVSISSQNVCVELGEVKSGVDFVLFQGARIRGFITRDGINALPGITVVILDNNGSARDQQTSSNDGKFNTNTISTGTYTVLPILDSKETVTPSSQTVTMLSPGISYFSSTFTISNALGYIQGSVKQAGQPIKTGVLVVVTTVTLSGTPPAPPDISTATLSGPPYYITSSNEEGNYTAEVRQSTNPTYNVYAYYSTPSAFTCSISSAGATNVSVLAGQYTTGVNFSW